MKITQAESEINEIFTELDQGFTLEDAELKVSFQRKNHLLRTLYPESERNKITQRYYGIPFEIIQSQAETRFNTLFLVEEYVAKGHDLAPKVFKHSMEGIEASMLSEYGYKSNYIWCCLSDKFHGFKKDYRTYLNLIRGEFQLSAATSEQQILTLLIERYKGVLNSTNSQLKFFEYLILPKPLADLYAKIWLLFFEDRLAMLKASLVEFVDREKDNSQGLSLPDYRWLGTQKELAELFIVLEERNWIGPIAYGDRSKVGRAIAQFFNLRTAKSSSSSNPINSFVQIYRGEPKETIKTDRAYPGVYSKRYHQKFEQIKEKKPSKS
ncbi:MAG: hypothetical protein AAFN93_02655 [Bacteroidota bacterium]